MLLVNLREQISSDFNLSELEDLCFELNITYEDLSGDNTLKVKSRELVKYCNRRKILQQLIDHCKELRPNSNWDIWEQEDLQAFADAPPEKTFSLPIRKQMAELKKTVDALTQDQYEIIKWLRGKRHVAIAGCAGSGKTLVAAEKATRLDAAGLRTLILCHNPRLAKHLENLTATTGVVVHDFLSWIYLIVEDTPKQDLSWQTYTNFQEPIPHELKQAKENLESSKLKYEAIIIDEAQDFRAEWWEIIEAALVHNGIMYAFHDDNQALLPNRFVPIFDESPYSLSKNCRNAGNIFKVLRGFHQQAPEVSLFLADKGIVKHTTFEDQKEEASIRLAIQAALDHFAPHDIIVLTTEHPPLKQSILNNIEIHEKVNWQWQEETLQIATIIASFKRSQTLMNEVKELRQSLSASSYPSKLDIQMVNSFFRPHATVDSHDIRRLKRIKWHLNTNNELELLRPKNIRVELLAAFFSSSNWVDNLPEIKSVRLMQLNEHLQPAMDTSVINFCDVATFKGLESPAVILFVRSARDNLTTNLYVGMSRASFYLHLITDKQVAAQIANNAWFKRLLATQQAIDTTSLD